MTARLNGIQCNRAELCVPRHGVPYATVEITEGATLTEGSRVTLVIAALSVSMTVIGAGLRGGVQYYELAGGAGGWGRIIPTTTDGGYRNDAGVLLSTVARDLATLMGESLATVPVSIDRSLGTHWLRGGGQNAGVLLSLACGLPDGAPRVPWYVTLSGVTTLGSRAALPAVALVEVDRDPLGSWVAYADEDATTLLPGATVEGRAIAVLEITATPEGVREVVVLEEPTQRTPVSKALAVMRDWVLDLLRPLFLTRGLYAYRVTRIVAGRYDAEPVRSIWAKPLSGLYIWPGAAGHHARAKVGSRLLVSFVDADPGQPAIVGFQPLDGSLGLPTLATFDAERVDLGDGDAGQLVARLTDETANGSLTVGPDASATAGVVVFGFLPVGAVVPSHTFTLTGVGLVATPGGVQGVPTGALVMRGEIDDVDQTKVFA